MLRGAASRSTVIIHVVSQLIANYPHIIALHQDNSNVGMCPDPFSLCEGSGSETSINTVYYCWCSCTCVIPILGGRNNTWGDIHVFSHCPIFLWRSLFANMDALNKVVFFCCQNCTFRKPSVNTVFYQLRTCQFGI